MSLLITADSMKHNIQGLLTKIASPLVLGRIANRVPHKVNLFLVERLINQAFEEQVNEGDFEFLEDRDLQIEIIDAKTFVCLTYSEGKLCCTQFSDERQTADVTLSIAVFDAIQLLQQSVDPDTLFFQRKLKINGDTELAHHVKNTIDTLDPDVIPDFVLRLMNEYQKLMLN